MAIRPSVTILTIKFDDDAAYSILSGATLAEFHVTASKTNGPSLEVSLRPDGSGSKFMIGGLPSHPTPEEIQLFNSIGERIPHATMVRFDPDNLRAPGYLIQESRRISFEDDRGGGLASVFDAIVNRDSEAFSRIQAHVHELFPSVLKVGLINISNSQKKIAVTLVDGTRVGAEGMSEGLLYYLGFAALKFIQGPQIFLVEEPENGLHPARISEVMDILREISKTSQVIIATHSPLVVNELKGDEVSVVTRDPEKGTEVKLLKDVPGFEDASKVYQPGEFWVSYCDGNREAPLLTGSPRT